MSEQNSHPNSRDNANRALIVEPGRAGTAAVTPVAEPSSADGDLLVSTIAVGICGTDLEITSGAYGWAPPGRSSLIIGHEAVGRVLEAPVDSGFSAGDL